MSTRMLSSGDMVADRRADYARMLADGGDAAAAADLMEQALERVPGWAAGWFLAAGYLETAGQRDKAGQALRRVLALSPDDVFGASLKLALLEGETPPDLPPSDYVRGLFDDYADRFDEALVNRLGYGVPGLLSALIDEAGGFAGPPPAIIDLGCGTGLMGVELAGKGASMEGWDLSPAMLAKARARALYSHLGEADLSLPPEASGLFAGRQRHRAGLVVAADVMMYLGNLEAALDNVAELADAGALIALSVEKAAAEDDFLLLPSLRYAHGRRFVKGALERRGMAVVTIREAVIRSDGGEPITGLLFAARKSG